ncbi:hypothetical protein [Streptosporangium sp. NPDC006930]|uniref:hypothetical protein n=1 Tax=Streptosporangium sp. NPDC006930 TaxID=3154783 RepID=UPI003446FC37
MINVSPGIGAYHGVHPAAPQADYERLMWRDCAPRADKIRIREHTCTCQRIVYELCQAGGLLFVRRMYRTDAVLMHESEWLRAVDGERLWLRILLGQVR